MGVRPRSATAFFEVRRPAVSPCWDATHPETALSADSGGVGQLIAEALRAGATRIVIGLGGSACTDGGKGMIAQLGGLQPAREQLADVELIAASDTEYPLLGPWGAARTFGPQKGANQPTVLILEARLTEWAARAGRGRGTRGERRAGLGTAGGSSAPGCSHSAGRCESGAELIAQLTRLDTETRDRGGHDRHR